MESWRRNLWILWFGVLFCSSSYTMVVPFLPLYLMNIGITEDVNMWSGIVFSITFLASAIMAPYWGSLSDKYGKKRMVIRAGLSLVVVYFLGAFVQDVWQLLAVRVLHGIVSGFVPASIAIVATNTPEKNLGWSLGMMQTAGAAGGILGPLLGGVLSDLFGMRMSFAIASVIVLIATLTVWTWVKEENFSPRKERSRITDDLKEAWHNKPLINMIVLLLLVQVSIMIIQPLLTLYIAELQGTVDGSELSSGIVFSVLGIATVIAAPIWGKWGTKHGYLKMLYIALIAAGVCNVFQIFWHDLISFGAVRFVIGMVLAGVFPAINALVVERTDPSFRGRAFGLTTSANQLGAMIGPLIGGALGGWFGIQTVFVLTGVLLAATGINVWLVGKRQAGQNSMARPSI